MRSVRLSDELESQLEQLSQQTGEPVSQIIREAVRKHCRAVLGGASERRLSYFVGAVKSTRRSRAATPLDNTGVTWGRGLDRRAPRKRKDGR